MIAPRLPALDREGGEELKGCRETIAMYVDTAPRRTAMIADQLATAARFRVIAERHEAVAAHLQADASTCCTADALIARVHAAVSALGGDTSYDLRCDYDDGRIDLAGLRRRAEGYELQVQRREVAA